MSRYNKLIAALVGNLLAILIAWMATKWPAIAECTAAPAEVQDAFDQVCTVAGFTTTQITAGLMVLINAVFVERWAANTP